MAGQGCCVMYCFSRKWCGTSDDVFCLISRPYISFRASSATTGYGGLTFDNKSGGVASVTTPEGARPNSMSKSNELGLLGMIRRKS